MSLTAAHLDIVNMVLDQHPDVRQRLFEALNVTAERVVRLRDELTPVQAPSPPVAEVGVSTNLALDNNSNMARNIYRWLSGQPRKEISPGEIRRGLADWNVICTKEQFTDAARELVAKKLVTHNGGQGVLRRYWLR